MNADRPSRPLWVGDYIRWWGGTDWEWIAYVKCGRATAHHREGYYPGRQIDYRENPSHAVRTSTISSITVTYLMAVVISATVSAASARRP
jgi:hypothetical protein